MEHEKLIQKYIHGNLTAEEQQAFDTLFENDSEFVKNVTEYENMHHAITASEKDDLKAHLQQLEATQVATETNKKPSRSYKRFAIAAVLILLFGLIGNYIIQQANAHETLYATYFEPYPNALAPVTRSSDLSEPLIEALYAYEIQEYETAIEKFDAVLQMDTTQKTELLFYKAMSLLNLGKEKEALNILREIKHAKTRFTPQIYWYGALIHLKRQENEKALKALQYMDAIQTTYKNKERTVLKSKLE